MNIPIRNTLFLLLALIAASPIAINAANNISITAENLAQHNLSLVRTSSTFDNGGLSISGRVQAEAGVQQSMCGVLEIQVFNSGGTLLQSLTTEYAPCLLSYRPKARRSGHFTASFPGVSPQPLEVKVVFHKKGPAPVASIMR